MKKEMTKEEAITALRQAIPGKRYQHYKGGLYIVHHLAMHTEDGGHAGYLSVSSLWNFLCTSTK
jgi:hypothetical protein